MIKYYPLFIPRSCLILISARSKHSEEVQDRCELWIIKINHFLTGIIVWSKPRRVRTTSPGSRSLLDQRVRPDPPTCHSLYLARLVSRLGGETISRWAAQQWYWGPVIDLFLEFWCQPKPVKQSETSGSVLWEAKQPGKSDGCRYDLAGFLNIGF